MEDRVGTDDLATERNRQLTQDPAFARELLESVLQAVPDVGRDEEVREIALAMVRASLESFAVASSTTCPESEIVEVEYARLLTNAVPQEASTAKLKATETAMRVARPAAMTDPRFCLDAVVPAGAPRTPARDEPRERSAARHGRPLSPEQCRREPAVRADSYTSSGPGVSSRPVETPAYQGSSGARASAWRVRCAPGRTWPSRRSW